MLSTEANPQTPGEEEEERVVVGAREVAVAADGTHGHPHLTEVEKVLQHWRLGRGWRGVVWLVFF